MKCPHLVDEQGDETVLCVAVLIPFEPSNIDQSHYCRTSRHRHCSLYRNAGNYLAQAIRREVARAIG